jgi:transcription antitermination factor NusG
MYISTKELIMKTQSNKSKEEIKYGDSVIIKDGFFKGITGIAVDYNEGLASKFGIEEIDDEYQIKINAGKFEGSTKRWFTCKQIDKVKPDKKALLEAITKVPVGLGLTPRTIKK